MYVRFWKCFGALKSLIKNTAWQLSISFALERTMNHLKIKVRNVLKCRFKVKERVINLPVQQRAMNVEACLRTTANLSSLK